jgi:hypothetical protein
VVIVDQGNRAVDLRVRRGEFRRPVHFLIKSLNASERFVYPRRAILPSLRSEEQSKARITS